jgi:hypothetical protein
MYRLPTPGDRNNMTIKLTPEREAELLEQHKQRQLALSEANSLLEKLQAEQKKKQQEFWRNHLKAHTIQKTRVPRKCSCCNATIPIGSQIIEKDELVNVSGSGWTGAFRTTYTCTICSNQVKKLELENRE